MLSPIAVRDLILQEIEKVFRDRNVYRGYPVFFSRELLPAIYTFISRIKYSAFAFGYTYSYELDLEIRMLYDAQEEIESRNRGYFNEDYILQDIERLSNTLYNVKIRENDNTVIELGDIVYELDLDREANVRVVSCTARIIYYGKEV